MTSVYHERFTIQRTMEKVKAVASGNCFLGVCAVYSKANGAVALIAHDVETLEIAWGDISPVPLKRDGVQRVAIFSQTSLEILNTRTDIQECGK